jgi:co-chaperonin GroES (HSP10)
MIQPIRNQILFKPFIGDGISENGIIVPESYRGESDKGVIVEIGNGSKIKPMELKKGYIGYRVHLWGEPIDYNGERFYLMEDSAIIALN